MTPVLSAEKVTVQVGTQILLDCVSVSFAPGEATAIVGPNGAGKTTLLRALAGELRTRSGHVRLKGRLLADYPPRELARHRAVLSQSISVAFPFTVADVVRMGADDRPRRNIDALVDAALDEVGLAAFSTRIVTTLSGGEQQRVHFARVLVQLACGEAQHGPGLLLLDEPTSSLDLKHQIELLARARQQANRGLAVIAVLHDLNLAALFAQRVIVMRDGQIDQDGTPNEIITAPMVERVFGARAVVGRMPPDGMPFVLPQAFVPGHLRERRHDM